MRFLCWLNLFVDHHISAVLSFSTSRLTETVGLESFYNVISNSLWLPQLEKSRLAVKILSWSTFMLSLMWSCPWKEKQLRLAEVVGHIAGTISNNYYVLPTDLSEVGTYCVYEYHPFGNRYTTVPGTVNCTYSKVECELTLVVYEWYQSSSNKNCAQRLNNQNFSHPIND